MWNQKSKNLEVGEMQVTVSAPKNYVFSHHLHHYQLPK